MDTRSVTAIVSELNRNHARYLIVGGLAVVAHGFTRFTADVDIVVAVDAQNLASVIAALSGLGYQPRAPVPFSEFANSKSRQSWATEKNMTVFSLFSKAQASTEVDLFLEPPFDFNAAYSRAVSFEVQPGIIATVCSLEELIEMKRKAARPRDLVDIEQLKRLTEGESHEPPRIR